ncbi:hypothetical protein QJQ45_028334, partial [Haematococcus lacustris]
MHVQVRTLPGAIVSVANAESMTVEGVLSRAAEATGMHAAISGEQLSLSYAGRRLPGGDTLTQCRVPSGATLHMAAALPGGKPVTVKLLTPQTATKGCGAEVTIDIEEDTPMYEVKLRLQVGRSILAMHLQASAAESVAEVVPRPTTGDHWSACSSTKGDAGWHRANGDGRQKNKHWIHALRLHGQLVSCNPMRGAPFILFESLYSRCNHSGISHSCALHEARIAELEAELQVLRKQHTPSATGELLVSAKSNTNGCMTTAANISDRVQITVDLVSLLDYEYYLYGIFWSPRVCFPAFKTVYPQLPEAELSQLTQRYVQAVQVALAEHLKVPPASIALDKPWTQQPAVMQEFAARHQQQGSVPGAILNPPALTTSQMAADPVYLAWRKRLTLLNSAWFTEADSSPAVECPPTVTKGVQQPWEQLGTKSCVGLIDDTLIIEETGYAFMPHMPLTGLGEHLKNHGICTSQARWGDMMLQQRMGQPQWQTYRTQRPEHDTVLELFDILYERTAAFTKQHFM